MKEFVPREPCLAHLCASNLCPQKWVRRNSDESVRLFTLYGFASAASLTHAVSWPLPTHWAPPPLGTGPGALITRADTGDQAEDIPGCRWCEPHLFIFVILINRRSLCPAPELLLTLAVLSAYSVVSSLQYSALILWSVHCSTQRLLCGQFTPLTSLCFYIQHSLIRVKGLKSIIRMFKIPLWPHRAWNKWTDIILCAARKKSSGISKHKERGEGLENI